MQRYRIILRDYLNLGRDRDVTFTALGETEEFINSLSREGTVCVYVVTGYNDYGPRALTYVERYVVWNDRARYAALEGNRQAAG